MAYAAVLSLLQTLEQIPQPVQQITSLREKVSQLLVILEYPSEESGLTINHLEGRIRDASFEAEDIIQSLVSRQVLPRSIICGVGSCFGEMISALQAMIPVLHIYEGHQKMELEFQDLEKIIDEFDSILDALSSKVKDGKVEALQPGNSLSTSGSSRFASSHKSTLVVGLDEDLMQIKDRLTGSPSKLDIISIVGMGGIGKTTLARNLYNDKLIDYHFDIRAWVVVSQEYHLQQVLSSLVDSTRHFGDELHQESIEQLAVHLYQNLMGRRYFIVMDDVWGTKAWDDVKRFFPDDGNGSRIILTTRLSKVAIYANCYGLIHYMSLLNSKASWSLLQEKVFGKECCPTALEDVGKKIAQNCKGLPLAIIVIGGLLSKGSRKRDYWEYIAKDVTSQVTGIGDQFMEILSLSYTSLPHHLKACFLYMAVFPEDYVIFASQLIKLWIAEGFIKPVAHKSLEVVAANYLKDLIDRSLILVDKRNHHGGIKTCIIHDLLRELCVKKAQDEKFLQIMNWKIRAFPQGKKNQRHVSVHSNIVDRFINIHDSYVRSLLYFFKGPSNNQLMSFTMSFRLLRLLDALTIWFYEFPIEIVELVHLRYLGFIYKGKSSFPASISKLRSLQTLIVYRGFITSIVKVDTLYLPSNIWEMSQLRHLLFEKSFLPYPFPRREDSVVLLENLQTLSEVTDFKCTKEVCKIMPNLKKQGISYFYDDQTLWSSYEFKNFVHLRKLQTLKCLFIPKFFIDAYPLPVDFAFPRKLKKLTLSGCRISWEKMTVIGSLPNLQVLKLKDHAFYGLEWKPNEGEFRRLKFLLMHRISLKHWRAKDIHFPRLQHLSLSFCSNLEEIPSEVGEIPTLEMLELYECSPSAVHSASLIQLEQESLENDTLRVRINSFRDNYYSQQNTTLRKAHRAFIRI